MIDSRLLGLVAVLLTGQISGTAEAQLAFPPPTADSNVNFPGPDWATRTA